jgi:hypothetical protein
VRANAVSTETLVSFVCLLEHLYGCRSVFHSAIILLLRRALSRRAPTTRRGVKMRARGEMLAVFRSCHKHLGGLCELRIWPKVPVRVSNRKKEWQRREMVRLREKAERKTKLVLVVAAIRQTLGLRIQLPSSTSSTGTQSAGTFWWGEAALRAHRHSWRHNGKQSCSRKRALR